MKPDYMKYDGRTEEPPYQTAADEVARPVDGLVMPIGDFFVDDVLKAMLIAGFEQTVKDNTNGVGSIDLDAAQGYLAGLIEAGLYIQKTIDSWIPVDVLTGKPLD